MDINILRHKNQHYNSTKGSCLRNPSHKSEKNRNDFKFCSNSCKVLYGIERRKKGFIKKVFSGNKDDLKKYLSDKLEKTNNKQLFNLHFMSDFAKIEASLKEKGLDKSWYADHDGFRVHYIANKPNNPLEIYYTLSKWTLMKTYLIRIPK
jgi:hypothetical protein